MGLALTGASVIMLIYMQSEFAKDYFPKLLLGVIGVAVATTLVQILVMWMVRLHKKGPVFFINRKVDEELILEVRQRLQKEGCVCYPKSDMDLRTLIETLTEQIRTSRLIVVLLTPDYEDSQYIQGLLKIVKKEKRKNVLFFTHGEDIAMPQPFRQSVPVLLEGHDQDAKIMEDAIFQQLTKF